MTQIRSSLKFRLVISLLLNLVAAGPLVQASAAQPQKPFGMPPGNQKVLGPITVQVPKGWVEQSPTSSMRKLQYNLPRVSGDAEDGELVVFYFGPGQGGGAEANIDRWVGQFAQPDGTPSRKRAKIDKRQVSGMPVTVLDLKGTYQAPVTPMSTQHYNKPNYRMLTAIVETPQGSYFFKLTGPEKTIGHWAESFQQFIDSIRKR